LETLWKPERALCEFLLGFGEERRGDGGEKDGGRRVVWVGGLISLDPENALETRTGSLRIFVNF